MIDALQKAYANYFLKPFLQRYLRRERMFHHDSLELKIYPGVFHPKYFFSTKVLVDFLDTLDVENKSFCEIGAGSGLISFVAYRKKARVTALDISPTATKGLQENFKRNFGDAKEFSIFQSDLFASVPPSSFDIIFINPPYFFKNVSDEDELAWNCGENGEYFAALFNQLSGFTHAQSEVYMILSENCELSRIETIAKGRNIAMQLHCEMKVKWEKNYIFKLIINHGTGAR
jgi:release factor glutamine methyltransferase